MPHLRRQKKAVKTLAQTLMALFVVGVLSGCVSNPETDAPLRLRVLTYNIHHGRGADGVIDLQRLADIIKRAKPDLVALQEVDVKTKRSGGVDQAAKLGELTGMHPYFAEAMPFQGGGYGEAVLSKWSIREDVSLAISLKADPGQEPRAVAVISAKPCDGWTLRIDFAGTHLCHQSDQTRLRQVQAINDIMADSGAATILAGDFNFTPDSEAYAAMLAAGWVDTAQAFGDPKSTYPSDKPRIRIDHVFVRPADRWRVLNVQVLNEPVASDHAPLLVELKYIHP